MSYKIVATKSYSDWKDSLLQSQVSSVSGDVTFLSNASGNWDSTFTTVNSNSATWEDADRAMKAYYYDDPDIDITTESAFIFDSGTGTITNYSITLGGADVVVPYEIDGVPVTTIGTGAFSPDAITSLTVSRNTVTFKANACQNCSLLTSVIAPYVTTIGDYTFRYCTMLTTVNMPLLSGIPTGAFAYDSNLVSVSFPEATYIGQSSFFDCTNLESIEIPKVTYIDYAAFYECVSLLDITTPLLTSIGIYSFFLCTSLSAVNLYADAPTIGMDAYLNSNYVVNYVLSPTATGYGDTLGGKPVVLMDYNLNSLIADTVSATVFNISGTDITWNPDDHTINIPTMEHDAVLQVGQETYLPYALGKNNTGSIINNGSVVYLCASGDEICIDLADNSVPSIVEKTVGVVTEDIPIGQTGIVTTYGLVRGLNTSSWSVGDTLYVEKAGNATSTRPTSGDWVIPMGEVVSSDLTDGIVFVKYLQVFDPDDLKNATGFPEQNAMVKQSDVSFSNAASALSIAPNTAGGYDSFYVWQLGVKHIFTESQTSVLTEGEGLYWFYFDDGVLLNAHNPTTSESESLIRTKVLVAQLYWNGEDSEAVLIGDERHGHIMSSDTHAYLHYSRGAQWLNGLALNNIDAGSSGNLDSHAQFGVDSGVTADEDLLNISTGTLSGAGLPIFWLKGTEKYLRRESYPGFSVMTDISAGVGSTGRLVYNDLTAGTLITVDNNNYVLCHVLATNSKQDPSIAFIGQNDYGTISLARAGANTEINTILTQYPNEELVPIATVIFQTQDNDANTVKAHIATTDEGGDYVDWRYSELQPGAAPTVHANLAGLTSDDHTQYALVDGTRDFTGEPSFFLESTAGENLSAGNICYFKSDAKYWKAKADSSGTTAGRMLMCTEPISAGGSGTFLVRGTYADTGLTAGGTYFISTATAGAKTTALPSSGNFIRVVGTANSTTEFYFDPSKDYGEVE